jgi:hypothetical protein
MANLTLGSNVRVNKIPTKTAACRIQPVRLSRIGAIALVSLLSAGICAAQEQEQSTPDCLAKVARQKSGRKAKVVITDDDMPSHAKPVPEPSANSRSETTDGKDQAAKHPPTQTTPPSSLTQPVTLDQAQEQVKQLKQQEQMLIRYYDEMQRKLGETDSESRRRMYSESLASRDLSLSRKRKQIEEAERALQRIDKAGAPQGETTDAAK